MNIKRILKNKWLIAAVSVALLVSMCSTITHEYGPYYGKVVDADTKEPIEGAVVVLVFFTRQIVSADAGSSWRFFDVKEVVTDKNGEFRMEAKRYWSFKALSEWDAHPRVTIYKASYGCHHSHKRAKLDVDVMPSYTLPPDRFAIVYLPKLITLVERMDGQSHCIMPTDSYKKTPLYTVEINRDRTARGLDPLWR